MRSQEPMKHEVLLCLGLIVDRGMQCQEFIKAVQETLARCHLPQHWPAFEEDPTDPAEVRQWLFHVVRRRRQNRTWTDAEHTFLDQLVKCVQQCLGKSREELRKTLIAELLAIVSECMKPVWDRLKSDVEGFSELSLNATRIALRLAKIIVLERPPGTRQQLPERFSLWPWVDQGYQYRIEDVVRTILYGPIHPKGPPVPTDQDDRLFPRLMSGGIRQGLLVYYLEHWHAPKLRFAMGKFLHMRCSEPSAKPPKLLPLLLHPSSYKVDDKRGVQCVQCQKPYRWKALAPLSWGCDCGTLPVYCPECLNQIRITPKNCQSPLGIEQEHDPLGLSLDHVLVEKRRFVLRRAPQVPPAYGKIGRILKRCPTDPQIQMEVVTRLVDAACKRQDIPGVWLLALLLDREMKHPVATGNDVPESILKAVGKTLQKLSTYHTKKGSKSDHDKAEYMARVHEFLVYAGIRCDDTPCDTICRDRGHRALEQLVAQYINAREAETSKVHYVPDIAPGCMVSECFVMGKLSQRWSNLYARLGRTKQMLTPPPPPPPPELDEMSDEEKQLFRDTRAFFRELNPEIAAWARVAANYLIENEVEVDPQMWTPNNCKQLYTKLKENYFPFLPREYDDETTFDSKVALFSRRAEELFEQFRNQDKQMLRDMKAEMVRQFIELVMDYYDKMENKDIE